jgi:hypothetical protein
MKFSFKYTLMICVFSLNAFVLSAQLDFSGEWVLDHSKSDAEFRDYQITCLITQTSQTFTVEQILVMKNGERSAMPAVTYNLDGKEITREEQGGKDKFSARWTSEDQKTLTVKYVRNMDGHDYGSITTYKLSEYGKILTVNTSDLKGESPMVQVYKKKSDF